MTIGDGPGAAIGKTMGSQPLAFISYRRTDAAQAAQGLHIQLRSRFGPSRIFMDVGAISVGDTWPERLRRALDKATVLLVVIGPTWLSSADRFGRRRLDQASDWVRNEIISAIDSVRPFCPFLWGLPQRFQQRTDCLQNSLRYSIVRPSGCATNVGTPTLTNLYGRW